MKGKRVMKKLDYEPCIIKIIVFGTDETVNTSDQLFHEK